MGLNYEGLTASWRSLTQWKRIIILFPRAASHTRNNDKSARWCLVSRRDLTPFHDRRKHMCQNPDSCLHIMHLQHLMTKNRSGTQLTVKAAAYDAHNAVLVGYEFPLCRTLIGFWDYVCSSLDSNAQKCYIGKKTTTYNVQKSDVQIGSTLGFENMMLKMLSNRKVYNPSSFLWCQNAV